MEINISYKFLLNKNGILFLVTEDNVDSQHDFQLIMEGEEFYLKIGNIFSLINDEIARHIRCLSEKHETINFAWYQSATEAYEMKFLFAKAIYRGDCSRLVVLYDLKKKGLISSCLNN